MSSLGDGDGNLPWALNNLLGHLQQAFASRDIGMVDSEQRQHGTTVALLREALGEPRLQQLLQQGRLLGDAEARALVVAELAEAG